MKVSSIVLLLCAILSPVFAQNVTFTTATTIGCGNTAYEGFNVTVNGCLLTVDCLHSFNSLRLINGATLTHTSGDSLGVYLTIVHTMSVDSSSHVNVVAHGYGPSLGPGGGYTTDAYGSGGGHGGVGGVATVVDTGGAGYGLIGTPLELGSGGGASGGFGGGVIHLTVGDTLLVRGGLWANGGNCSNTAGAGAGGSILITANVIAGAGQITATGGTAQSTGGGGGGGRIALYYGTYSFTGTISVCGGSGFQYGGPGTLYKKANSQNLGELDVSNCTISGSGETPLYNLPACNATIQYRAVTRIMDSTLTVAGNLHIAGTGQVWVSAMTPTLITVHGKLIIDSAGVLSAEGCGYPEATGPGAGGASGSYGGGGGHGGAGGNGYNSAPGGVSYGTIATPEDFGSGGNGLFGSAGGGALHLVVDDTLRVNGVLSVNGATAGSLSGGGGGGSMYLQVGKLSGRGSITAVGGQAGSNGGGGGGGRLALYYTTNLFAGTLSACGGWGYRYGGAGTLYLKAANQTFAELTVSNCGHSSVGTSLVSTPAANVTINSGGMGECQDSIMTIAGNLYVAATGQLVAAAGQSLHLTINGDARVDSLGAISASGRGWPRGMGLGAGATGGTYGGGGGYGGAGGVATGNVPGGTTYGLAAKPQFMGSGGGGAAGGAGGGALFLTVLDTLTVGGTVSSNGAESGAYGGGGSGGTLYLTAHAIVGNGYLTTNGGQGYVGGGGGGGGRLAIYACGRTVPVSHITSTGGNAAHPGFAGTIYLGNADCNNNGIPDGCDIAAGTSSDCNINGVPDECENITAPLAILDYTSDGSLFIRWNCVPGFSQYRVYGRYLNNPEILLTTTSDLYYDASALLDNPDHIVQRWIFRVVGYQP